VSFSSSGLPVLIQRVDDVGRHRIVSTEYDGQTIRMIVPESEAIPVGTACINLQRDKTALYVDGWRAGVAQNIAASGAQA